MKYQIKEIFQKYPVVFEITGPNINSETFYAILSPFANCQTFCFTYVSAILKIADSDMKEFMSDLYMRVEKKQCVIDVNANKSEEILLKFTPFIQNIISTPYKSTNGSSMILHLIQMETKMLD